MAFILPKRTRPLSREFHLSFVALWEAVAAAKNDWRGVVLAKRKAPALGHVSLCLTNCTATQILYPHRLREALWWRTTGRLNCPHCTILLEDLLENL